MSPDGKRGLSTSGDILTLWGLPGGSLLRTFEPVPGKSLAGHIFSQHYEFRRTIACLAVDWQRQIAVTGDYQGMVRVWSMDTGKLRWAVQATADDPPLAYGITGVALSKDGRRVFSSGVERDLPAEVKVWDLERGEQLATIARIEDGEPGRGYHYILPLSVENRLLLAGGGDLTLWDLAQAKATWRMKGLAPRLLDATEDGRRLLEYTGKAVIVSQAKGEIERVLWKPSFRDSHQVVSIALAQPDRKLALTGGYLGDLVLWDVDTGKDLALWNTSPYREAVHSIAIAAEAKLVLTESDNDVLQLWDLATGKVLRTLTAGPKKRVRLGN
jgi:WD40 repeat protein